MELLIFGIMVGGFILIGGLYMRQKATPAPSKRLFSKNTEEIIPEDSQKKLIAAHLAKKIQKVIGFANDPIELKEIKKRLIMAGLYGDRAMTNFIIAKVAFPILGLALSIPLIWNLNVSFAIKPVIFYLPIAFG